MAEKRVNMKHIQKKVIRSIITSVLTIMCWLPLFATHNVNRYLPFLERPEDVLLKKNTQISLSAFYDNASTAKKRWGGNGGLYDLWGTYDLKDVITSLKAVKPTSDPIYEVTGSHALDGKSMIFKAGGKMRVWGLQLNGTQKLPWHFSVGASLPVMNVSTYNWYDFNVNESASNVFNNNSGKLVDQIRRQTHKDIGFEGNVWRKDGLGDIDAYLRWNQKINYILMMKSLNFNVMCGVIAPSGTTSSPDSPSSLSFGSDGHWGMYGDFLLDIELKQDLNFGFLLGYAHLFPHTRRLRISCENEPTIFSSIVGDVRKKPGDTFKFSTYLTLENLSDGLHLQARYTYLRHADDTWIDNRSDKSVKSYLQKDASLIDYKKGLTRWREHLFTFQLMYEIAQTSQSVRFDPTFFVLLDVPMAGSSYAKTFNCAVGCGLQF